MKRKTNLDEVNLLEKTEGKQKEKEKEKDKEWLKEW